MKMSFLPLRVGVAILCISSIALNVTLWREITSFHRNLAAHETDLTLSLSDCKNMLSDLESPDRRRLDSWKLELSHHIQRESSPKPRNIDELLTLYKSKEPFGRSNYFADLVFNLGATPGLTKTFVLRYLGAPDSSEITAEGETLWYRYKLNGKDASAFVIVSSNASAVIGFKEDGPSEGNQTNARTTNDIK